MVRANIVSFVRLHLMIKIMRYLANCRNAKNYLTAKVSVHKRILAVRFFLFQVPNF